MKHVSSVIIILFVLAAMVSAQYTTWGNQQQQQQPLGDTREVTAIGLGAILAGDVVKAKEDATNDALRKAVEQVVGLIIDAQTVTENFMVIEDNIYSKTTGYVQSYTVLNTITRVDNSMEVTVKAIVKTGSLKNDLEGILTVLRSEGMPRLMVLVKEENISQHYGSISRDLNTTETALMNEMMNYGFPFVDAQTAKMNVAQDVLNAALLGDAQVAADIAKRNGAEILVFGTAATTISQPPVMRSSGMKSCNANLNLRVVRADDAVIIATTGNHGVAAHIDELTGSTQALTKASKAAAQTLKDQIVEKFRKNQFSTRQIQLQVFNITDFDQLNTLKNNLPYYIRGVKKIYQRHFGSGSALFDIEITQKAETVAGEMAAKQIEGLQLDIIGVTQNKVTAKIKSSTPVPTNSGGLE